MYDIVVMADAGTVFEPDARYRPIKPLAHPAVGRSAGTSRWATGAGYWADGSTLNTSSGSTSTAARDSWVTIPSAVTISSRPKASR
jgi:hypothetical protein